MQIGGDVLVVWASILVNGRQRLFGAIYLTLSRFLIWDFHAEIRVEVGLANAVFINSAGNIQIIQADDAGEDKCEQNTDSDSNTGRGEQQGDGASQ